MGHWPVGSRGIVASRMCVRDNVGAAAGSLAPCPHTPAPNRWHIPPAPPSLQVAIERVLDELGLRHVADAPVGGSGGIRGVSGGERRR